MKQPERACEVKVKSKYHFVYINFNNLTAVTFYCSTYLKQSIVLLPAVFDDEVIQCIILFTLNVVTSNCFFSNGNKIKQVYHVHKKNSIILDDYHIFSQLGGRYNLKVRADFCVEYVLTWVRADPHP